MWRSGGLSSLRSCGCWYRRSHPSAVLASHASGIFQSHLRSGNDGEAASRLLVELHAVLPQDMSHLHKGARQRLAARAHRAVVTDPSSNCITPNFPCTSGRPLANRVWVRSAVGTFQTWAGTLPMSAVGG